MPCRVLTIEDENAIRKSFVAYLEDYDYEVIEAADGQEGLDMLEKHNPDVVLADLRMPKVDGLRILEYMGEHRPDIPVIVVSGTGNIQDVIEAMRLGAWDYILKPVQDMNILRYAVERAYEKSALEKENRRYRQQLEEEVQKKTEEFEKANDDLRRLNEELKNSLEEKNVLLRELHHRVKNNMQIIMSLLNLQRPSYKDEEDGMLMEKSIHRVHTMALVHDHLYRAENLTRVELQSYLDGMVGEILKTSPLWHSGIYIDIDAGDLQLDLEKAVPMGLIIHELLDNSLEHGFEGRDSGKIDIAGELSSDGTCRIEVRDDGVGIDEHIDLSTADSLGFLLVQTLVAQVNGKIEVFNDSGTRAVLTFPIEEE